MKKSIVPRMPVKEGKRVAIMAKIDETKIETAKAHLKKMGWTMHDLLEEAIDMFNEEMADKRRGA